HLRGASTITAVEAHQMAYLRCLVVKEAFNLTRARFLLGDFNALLAGSPKRYDYISACGVLYHMSNPVETATYITQRTDRIGIWTHYYDDSIRDREEMRHRFAPDSFTLSFGDICVEGYAHSYQELLDWSGFCGGGDETVTWLSLPTWQKIFDHLNFDLEI